MVMPVPDPTSTKLVVYLVCITERILYLIDDIAIILHVRCTVYLGVMIGSFTVAIFGPFSAHFDLIIIFQK